MTHHLNPNIHEQVHEAHIRRDGMHSLRQITAKVTLSDFVDDEHETLARALHSVSDQRRKYVELTIEVCVQCGFIERTTCHHGMSFWAHRPGCPKFDPQVFPNLPVGLYRHYEDAMSTEPKEDCSGCLLVCPVCKADGT